MTFLVVEQKEPHAGRMAFEDVKQPATFAERCALAERMRDELEVTMPIYVDGMDDASRALFSDLPSPAFLIDREGRIADKLPWADPEPLGNAITRLLRDEKPPAEPTPPPTSVEAREGAIRRAAFSSDPFLRAKWSRAEARAKPAEDLVTADEARLALARMALFAHRSDRLRHSSIREARAAAEKAFATETLRRVSAHAEALNALESMRTLPTWRETLEAWRGLAAAPMPDVEPRVRDWIARQRDRIEEPLTCFDAATRAEVERLIANPYQSRLDASGMKSLPVSDYVELIRVRFEKDVARLVTDSMTSTKKKGDVAFRADQVWAPQWLPSGSERWVLLVQLEAGLGFALSHCETLVSER